MNINNDAVMDVIYASMDELNEQLPPEVRLLKAPSTVILPGDNGLDSLAMVNLMAIVEEKSESAFGKSFVISDNLETSGPFETVQDLAKIIMAILQKGSS